MIAAGVLCCIAADHCNKRCEFSSGWKWGVYPFLISRRTSLQSIQLRHVIWLVVIYQISFAIVGNLTRISNWTVAKYHNWLATRWWVMGDGWWVMGDGWWVMGDGWWVMGDGLFLTEWNLVSGIRHQFNVFVCSYDGDIKKLNSEYGTSYANFDAVCVSSSGMLPCTPSAHCWSHWNWIEFQTVLG